MTVLLWAVRILIILLILRIVLRWFAERRLATVRRQATRVSERAGGALVRDPQCGTYVAKSAAIAAQGHAFCSVACREAWVAAQRAQPRAGR